MTFESKDTERINLLINTLIHGTEVLTLVLKTHLFCEYLVDELLLNHLGAKTPHVESLDLRFSQKLSLIRSLGLMPPEGIESLNRLNALRNKCVYKLNFTPSNKEIRAIIEPLPAEWLSMHIKSRPEAILQRFMGFMCGFAIEPFDAPEKK